ncbi:MAG TPA: biotin/lipoate A/B protein ligase family protein [Longimicrobiales bacterium]
MVWRLIDDAVARPGPANMAIDQALLESVQAGGRPALRFYRWRPACLSFGRNQPARGLCDRAAAARRGVDIVRRPTGGLAVLHDRELTYAVALPVGALGTPRETYRALNRALMAGLRELGLEAELAPSAPPWAAGALAGAARNHGLSAASQPGAGSADAPAAVATAGGALRAAAPSCFQAPAPGEVVVAGRKLVGSAQRVERRTILQHGSLLLEGDQALVAELLAGPLPPAPATLAAALGRRPDPAELVAALCAGFEAALGIRLAPGELSRAERERAGRLVAHFSADAWTWRC